MAKNPTYGFEKPYLEEIEKEITKSTDIIYYDDFNNLIAEKKPNSTSEEAKTVLFAFCVSDNAFLVNEKKENGNAGIASLMGGCEEYAGKKAVSSTGKTGFIKVVDKKLECDFGYTDKKTASKYIKCGDVISIKQSCEQSGESLFTNAPSMLLKNIFTECINEYYNNKVIFAFLREQKKGAYAIGKSVKCDEAYFFTFSDEIKDDISFIKKEGSYIASHSVKDLPVCVLEKDISFASQFYFSAGIKKSCGIAIKKTNIGDGIFKITKASVNEIKKFIKGN